MPKGIGYHENVRLEDRSHKSIDEVLGVLKASKKPKKKVKKKGLKKTKLRSKRNRQIQDLIDKVK